MTDPSYNNDTAPDEISIFDNVKPLPVYYSEKAIYGFSFLFGAMFGSVMLAMNIARSPQRKGIWQVLLFGFFFTVMQGSVSSIFPNMGSVPSIIFNIGAAQIIKAYFWPMYIGRGVNYTKRSIWPPAIIGIAIILLVVLAIVAAGMLPGV